MKENEDRVRDAIVEQATQWYLRHRDDDLTTATRQEFLSWLRASLQHTSEYLAIARLCGGFQEAIADLKLDQGRLQDEIRRTDDDGVIALEPKDARHARRFRVPPRFRRRGSIGLAAAALAGVCASYWLAAPGFAGLPRAISVAHGEQRTVQLSDGSVVHVNASSRLVVRFSRGQRLIELERGQAMFEVAHDPSQPFRVRAGTAEVTAVGTQFDVYRRGAGEVTVTVVQGKVNVESLEAPHSATAGGPTAAASSSMRLGAGEQVQFDVSAKLLKSRRIDIRTATAWVRREVMFEGRPLREVTQEFNRYISKPIEIEDPQLNDLQVSGVFNAYDSESFLVFLGQYDVRVTEDAKAIRVMRRGQH